MFYKHKKDDNGKIEVLEFYPVRSVFFQYQCCGVYGYSDFKEASAWRSDVVAGGTSYSLSVPIVCCDQLPTSTDLSCAGATTGINANKVGNPSTDQPKVPRHYSSVYLVILLTVIYECCTCI